MRFLAVLALILLVPIATNAATVVRTGDLVSIKADQSVEGDFYGLASNIAISGNVSEDALLMAGKVTINGTIGADALVLGGNVHVGGIVNDDIRVMAGGVVVEGEVKGNLVVVASDLKILSTARIAGDVLFYGSKLTIEGEVGRDVFGTNDQLSIDGLVGGRVDVSTKQLMLGERAEIVGDVRYVSWGEVVRAPGSKVGGQLVKNDPTLDEVFDFRNLVIPFLMILFASLVWQLIAPRFVQALIDRSEGHTARALLVGFGFVVLSPIVIVILLASTLGSLLAAAFLFVYFALISVSFMSVGVVAGSHLFKLIKRPTPANVLLIVLGVTSLYLLMLVPVVGLFIFIGFWLLTLGAAVEKMYQTLRFDS